MSAGDKIPPCPGGILRGTLHTMTPVSMLDARHEMEETYLILRTTAMHSKTLSHLQDDTYTHMARLGCTHTLRFCIAN